MLSAHRSLFPFVFPHHFYPFRIVFKIGAFLVALAGITTTRRTNVIAFAVPKFVVLVAARAAEQVHRTAAVPVFGHRGGRIPFGLFSYRIDPCLYAGRKAVLCRFAAGLRQHGDQGESAD